MEKVDQLVNTDICATLRECIRTDQYFLGIMLGKIKGEELGFNISQNTIISQEFNQLMTDLYTRSTGQVKRKTKVQLLCNWCSSEELANVWNKMSQGGYQWNDLQIVWDDPNPDYHVIVNAPPRGVEFDKKKTIIFQMEPKMAENPKIWGEYADPSEDDFLKVCKHSNEYNNSEWHLSKTWREFNEMKIEKTEDAVVSTVLSGKYSDPGHVKRVDFVKHLDKSGIPVHVYGSNKWNYKDYRGSLPYHCKDEAMFPYKYTFNVENHSLKNYWTEKIIDGILAESLVFYNGCYNLKEFLPEGSYVYLELSNFENDTEVIRKAMEENLWEKRLPVIREAKAKILTYFQFFPRLERIIAEHQSENQVEN